MKPMMPYAREEGLIVQTLPDEALVYDVKRHRAHCLNRTAALVWRHCDGQTSVAEVAALLEKELKLPAEEELVWMALGQLRRAHLLKERVSPTKGAAGYSRRQVVRKLGLMGGLTVLLPMVSSIVAPTGAQAAAPTFFAACKKKPNCAACNLPSGRGRCCNGVCVDRAAARAVCGCP